MSTGTVRFCAEKEMSNFATNGQPPTCASGRLRGPSPCRVDLLLFARAREIAGTRSGSFRAATVADVLAQATVVYGPDFAAVLARSRVWVNGEPAGPDDLLVEGDEVAVLPPVSGG
jgi:molybdopterin synthase sulfur carrier subunit